MQTRIAPPDLLPVQLMSGMPLNRTAFTESFEGRLAPFTRLTPGPSAGRPWQSTDARQLAAEFGFDLHLGRITFLDRVERTEQVSRLTAGRTECR